LFEVDKASGNYRVLTEKDGLLMNQMTSLCLDRRSLWLGFGQGAAGGLGRLDLDSDRLSAFTPSLSSDPLRATAHDPQNGPPRHPVLRITCAGDQVWMLVDGIEPRRYDPAHDQWGGLPQMEGCRFDSLAVDTARMVVAFGRPQKVVVLVDEGVSPATENARTTRIPVDAKELDRFTSDPKMVVRIKLIDQVLLQTLGIMNLNDGGWHAIPGEVPLFARPTLLALHGSDAFLGGRGYIGIFDLEKKKMRKLCYIPVVGIDRFDFGGGYLWVQFRGYLYRVPLSELQ
jgi:hypothetical protein